MSQSNVTQKEQTSKWFTICWTGYYNVHSHAIIH